MSATNAKKAENTHLFFVTGVPKYPRETLFDLLSNLRYHKKKRGGEALFFATNMPPLRGLKTMSIFIECRRHDILVETSITRPQEAFIELPQNKKAFPDKGKAFLYAELTGFEPATSCVTGRRSNQTELQLH